MPRRILEGNVVSSKTDKTVTVLVERRYMHPKYKKYVKSSSKYTAHDENNTYKEGDKVSIIECRPISKTKRWMVMSEGEQAPSPAPAKAEKKAEKAEKPAAKKAPAKKADDKKAAAKKPAAKKATDKKAKTSKKDA